MMITTSHTVEYSLFAHKCEHDICSDGDQQKTNNSTDDTHTSYSTDIGAAMHANGCLCADDDHGTN